MGKKASVRKEEKSLADRLKRGPEISFKDITDRKLKGKLRHTENVFKESQKKAAKINEWLLPESSGYLEAEGAERTWQAKQEDIRAAVDVGAARKQLDLVLPELGPYKVNFTRSGRYMLLGGTKGHLAVTDWQRGDLLCEVQVRETVRDVCFLHNETFFAAAQKKYVYVYDKRGIEVHCLRDHTDTLALDFLPHHFMLTSIGEQGVLRYKDTSTGHLIAEHRTKLGPCGVMRQNPSNAVMCLGHARGCVTMWTPTQTSHVVKLLCHRGPIGALSIDESGQYLATAGADGQLKVWDLRHQYRPLHQYFTYSTVTSMDVSQRGLLAVGYGRKIQIWKDGLAQKQESPYMGHSLATHPTSGALTSLRFCPFEDVLALGTEGGVSTLLVPGAGEPNFDSYVANPFANVKERQEGEVRALLDKLQPDTITLDPDMVGRVRKEPEEVAKERAASQEEANRLALEMQRRRADERTKMKGKNRPSRRAKRKQTNIIEERNPAVRERAKAEIHNNVEQKKDEQRQKEQAAPAGTAKALLRFY
uniref:BING4 C-terminal domain-containing protein n=1 Tax=Polytomella parva TaxID=51329 RepID=A0A7S0V4M6_9CHLO